MITLLYHNTNQNNLFSLKKCEKQTRESNIIIWNFGTKLNVILILSRYIFEKKKSKSNLSDFYMRASLTTWWTLKQTSNSSRRDNFNVTTANFKCIFSPLRAKNCFKFLFLCLFFIKVINDFYVSLPNMSYLKKKKSEITIAIFCC